MVLFLYFVSFRIWTSVKKWLKMCCFDKQHKILIQPYEPWLDDTTRLGRYNCGPLHSDEKHQIRNVTPANGKLPWILVLCASPALAAWADGLAGGQVGLLAAWLTLCALTDNVCIVCVCTFNGGIPHATHLVFGFIINKIKSNFCNKQCIPQTVNVGLLIITIYLSYFFWYFIRGRGHVGLVGC